MGEAARRPIAELSTEEVEKLVRELEVHQVELEIQNDELAIAHRELGIASERYQDLYDFAPVGYFTITRDGLVQDANLTASRMLGLPRPRVLGQTFHKFVVRADEPLYFEHSRELIEGAHESRCELRLKRADGAACHVLLQSAPERDETGAVVAQRTIATDITARKAAETAWRQADAIVRAASEAIVVLDTDLCVTRVNPAFTALSGYAADEVGGLKLSDWVNAGDDEANQGIRRDVSQRGAWRGEAIIQRKDRERFPAELSLVEVTDERGNLTAYAGLFSDITERKRVEAQLRQHAFHDTLTGLPNRASFVDRVGTAAEEAHRHGHLLGLLIIDVDRFKEINDQFGHAAGDTLLQSVALRLTHSVRGHDTVARIGGDEFAVILTDIHHIQNVATIVEKMLERLAPPVAFAGCEIPCSVSVGIAVLPVDAEDTDALMRYADLALFRAKEAGRHTYRFFKESMTRQARAHARVQRELSRGLTLGEFRILYQPIIHAVSGELAGAEALLRWAHPNRGLLHPGRFLSVAEDTGQIMPLGSWVIETSAARWLELCSGRDADAIPFLSLNVSPRQLRYESAFKQTLEQLRVCGLPVERIFLEVTEGMAMNSAGKAGDHLNALKQLGVTLAMDDFGTGYSALGYLKDLPFDVLKIDQSFIQEVETNENAAHLVSAIVKMAHGLNLRTVAEGAESPPQVSFAREAGCDYIQGFAVSPPLTEDEMRRVLMCGLDAATPRLSQQ